MVDVFHDNVCSSSGLSKSQRCQVTKCPEHPNSLRPSGLIKSLLQLRLFVRRITPGDAPVRSSTTCELLPPKPSPPRSVRSQSNQLAIPL